MNTITLKTLKGVDGLTAYTDAGINGTKDKMDYIIALRLVCDEMHDNKTDEVTTDCWNDNGFFTGTMVFHRNLLEYDFDCNIGELKHTLQNLINKAI